MSFDVSKSWQWLFICLLTYRVRDNGSFVRLLPHEDRDNDYAHVFWHIEFVTMTYPYVFWHVKIVTRTIHMSFPQRLWQCLIQISREFMTMTIHVSFFAPHSAPYSLRSRLARLLPFQQGTGRNRRGGRDGAHSIVPGVGTDERGAQRGAAK